MKGRQNICGKKNEPKAVSVTMEKQTLVTTTCVGLFQPDGGQKMTIQIQVRWFARIQIRILPTSHTNASIEVVHVDHQETIPRS